MFLFKKNELKLLVFNFRIVADYKKYTQKKHSDIKILLKIFQNFIILKNF